MESQAMEHLSHLCVQIGARPAGSAANHAAAAYIQRIFEASGLEVEMQEFFCPVWKDKDTCLELGGERVEARANVFSPSCDVTAPAVAMGTLAELEAAELAGRIGVMHGDLTKNGLSGRNAIYFPERDQRILQLLEEKQPTALVTVNPGVGRLERLLQDWDFPIPSATVPAEVGLVLLRNSERRLHLRIDTHQSPGQSYNVVARKAGARPERVVLCAHLDTKLETPGAADDGAGVATLLALAQTLAHRDLATGIEWVAFNGEELGGPGDVVYWRRRDSEAGQMLAVINVDGVGHYLSASSITMLGGSPALQSQVSGLLKAYPSVAWVEPWYESNHSAFSWRGVPAIAISSVGGANVGHLPTDTVEWISPAKLGEVVALVTDIVVGLQDKSLEWCRE